MNLLEERVVLNCPDKKINLKAKCFSPPVWEGFLLGLASSPVSRFWCAVPVAGCLAGGSGPASPLIPAELPPQDKYFCSCRWISAPCWYKLLLSEGQQIADDLLKEWDVIVVTGCKRKVIWGATSQTLIFFTFISLRELWWELWCYSVGTCCSCGTIYVFPLHWNISTKLTCIFFWSTRCNTVRISKGR